MYHDENLMHEIFLHTYEYIEKVNYLDLVIHWGWQFICCTLLNLSDLLLKV